MRIFTRFGLLLFALIAWGMMFGVAGAQDDGYVIYFESDRDEEMKIYRVEGDNAVAVTQSGQEPSVTADGSILLYTRVEQTLWGRFWNVFIIQNGNERKLTTNEIYDELNPAISRDGTFAAYTSMRGGNLEIIALPLDENELQFRVTNTEKPDEEPTLAMGDEWVYWTGRTGNYSFLFRAPGRGGSAERISGEMVWEEHPSVSADGRYLVYSAVTQEPPGEMQEQESIKEESLQEESLEEESPEEEPEGGQSESARTPHKYPWMRGTSPQPAEEERDEEPASAEEEDVGMEGNSDIWVLDLVTRERVRLTTDPAWDGHPCISADGEKIVFTSDRDDNYEIYIINRDGTGLERLTNNEATDDNATIT